MAPIRRHVLAAKQIGALVIVALGAALAGVKLGRHMVHPLSYESQREKFVLVQAAVEGPVDTLVLGDSITESNDLDGLCGTTFAAGIGGAKIADIRRVAPTLIHLTHPKRIVLAIGTNDAWGESKSFRSDYDELLSSLPMKPSILVGIHNGDNAFIAAQARKIGAAYVPPIPANMTWDSYHPTPDGARLWRSNVARACH